MSKQGCKAVPVDSLVVSVRLAPIGTLAPAFMGGRWYKTEQGWKWNGPDGSGGTFPRPGGDWTGEYVVPMPAAAAPSCECKSERAPDAYMYQSEDPFDGGDWTLTFNKPNRKNVRPLYYTAPPCHCQSKDDEIAGVLRYCREVQADGTANERVVAQTVARMLAHPPAKPQEPKSSPGSCSASRGAAAPDLLAALRLAGSSAGFQYMTHETREAINAAISRAQGE
jgi:hypothetical protein